MNDRFAAWLADSTSGPCCFSERHHSYIFIRVSKSPDFDYLYCQRTYGAEGIQRREEFKYVGILCKRNGLLYDEQYDLKELTQASNEFAPSSLREKLQSDVRQRVERFIDDDRNKLMIRELTGTVMQFKLDGYNAARNAREIFLSEEGLDSRAFHCEYDAPDWTEDSLLAYILAPDEYADREAEAYIANEQEEILLSFLWHDALMAAYQEILDHPENPVHCIRRIMAGMRTTTAKTVIVTIRKEDQEFTFKTEASPLRMDCGSNYGTWRMAAQDRRKFVELYGRSADYSPQEIVRITYARTVIYEANPR